MNPTTVAPMAEKAAASKTGLTNASFAEIAQILREHESFLVLSHVRPDGDALGSEIAMGLALRQMGKTVKVWNEEGLLEKFSFFPGGEMVSLPPNEAEDFDVVFALDTATRQRLGDNCLAAIGNARIWVNIDHHPSNPRYGDFVHIDPTAPATGQILFEFLQSQKLPLDEAIAENLFAAISTDTGSFQYPQTTARTFEIAADILRCGINVGRLSQQLYESYPRRRIELLRVLLDRMRFDAGGKVASFSLPIVTANELGVIPEDNEGLIDHLRAIQGVIVAIFFEELEDGNVRVSMRSKDERADVCAICVSFRGGGHKLAAGARVPGALDDVAERVIAAAVTAVTPLQNQP
ncbi:MAG TPA: bifunctional oligoribonuclease/PAP phosphatase NrnA [Chthoniobacterales bacterium]